MTVGRIVHEPSGHRCEAPGRATDRPAGTVWACDECGTHWIAEMPFGTIVASPGWREWCRMGRWRTRRFKKRHARAVT